MKRRITLAISLFALISLFAVAFFAPPIQASTALMIAQEPSPVTPPVLDPTTVEAILVIAAGGVVTLITQFLKKKLKIDGVLAKVLDGGIGVVIVAVYFLILNPPFEVIKFALYSVVIFGESTGWYHLYQKRVV